MKKTLAILALVHLHLFSTPLLAAVPLRWTVETSAANPVTFDQFAGATYDLEASMQSRGKPLAVPGDPQLFWQTNGMGSAWWTAPATASGNVFRATWTPRCDVGAKVYNCFIGINGTTYNAAFQLRLRPSPGATPNALPLPTPVIDFAKVHVLNPPWLDGSNFVTRTELTAATNALDTAIRGEIGAATNGLRSVDGAARVLPKYLHALDFADSYPDAAAEYYRSRGDGKVDGGCSAVRDGGALYRNFDFPLDDRAEFVVTMAAGAGRFASVGVAQVGTNLTEAIVTSGKPSPCYKWLPGATVDGINERGVACNINVVDGDPQTSGWHTTGNLHPIGAIRWILDNATNAQHGAEYIAANIRFPDGWEQNFHYMIADKTDTFIVENGNCYRAGLYDLVKPVLTNFRVVGTQEGSGIERYNLLLGGANITNAWYTRAYHRSTTPPWVSDLAEVIDYTNEIFTAWANNPREHFRNQRINGQPWWQTVHTSIYDLTNKTLRVAVQEEDDWYTFQVPSAGGIEEEIDPTVAWWARAGWPEPMTDLSPATNYTDAATNAIYAASTNYTDAATNALAALIPGSYTPDPTDPAFSNAVLAVNLGIDTNQVAALAELAGLPISEGAGTVGGLLMLLVAAVLALKRGKADGNKTYFAAGDGAECTGTDAATITGGGTDAWVAGSTTMRVATFSGNGTIALPAGVTEARILVVGGGGGGGSGWNGAGYDGGGGGGVLDRTVPVSAGVPIAVVVGAGGEGGTNSSYGGKAGGDSSVTVGDKEFVARGGTASSGKSGGCGGYEVKEFGATIETGGQHAGKDYGQNMIGNGGAGASGDAVAKSKKGIDGIVSDISGVEEKFGAGGGGGGGSTSIGNGGDYGGGTGRGGAGGQVGGAGADGYGAGGGGASYNANGGVGGRGVVKIAYSVASIGKVGIAIGQNAKSAAAHAMQIGEGTNSEPMTVKFHDYLMLKADGTIPEERMPNTMISHEDFAGVTELGAEFTDNEIGQKVDQIIRLLRGTTAAIIAALFVRGTFAASVTTAVKGEIPNTSNVVTAVDFDGLLRAESDPNVGLTNRTLTVRGVSVDIPTSGGGGGDPGNYQIVSNLAMNALVTNVYGEIKDVVKVSPEGRLDPQDSRHDYGFNYHYTDWQDDKHITENVNVGKDIQNRLGLYVEHQLSENSYWNVRTAHYAEDRIKLTSITQSSSGYQSYRWDSTYNISGITMHHYEKTGNIQTSSTSNYKFPLPPSGFAGETNLTFAMVEDFSPNNSKFKNGVLAVAQGKDNPIAWGKYTSDGGTAPSNTVFISSPRTVFAGGLEFEQVEIAGCSVGVLTSRGAPSYTYGDEGTFKIQTVLSTNWFGIVNGEHYTIGCNVSALTNTPPSSASPSQMIQLVYDVTMEGVPCVWYMASLEDYDERNWEQLNYSDGTPVAGASHVVAWEQNPPPGKQVCYINCRTEDKAFFVSTIEVGGITTFKSTMPADLSGGVLCTDGHTIIYPHADGTWRTTK